MSFLMTLFTRRVPASSCGDDHALPGSRDQGRQEPAGGLPDLSWLPHPASCPHRLPARLSALREQSHGRVLPRVCAIYSGGSVRAAPPLASRPARAPSARGNEPSGLALALPRVLRVERGREQLHDGPSTRHAQARATGELHRVFVDSREQLGREAETARRCLAHAAYVAHTQTHVDCARECYRGDASVWRSRIRMTSARGLPPTKATSLSRSLAPAT